MLDTTKILVDGGLISLFFVVAILGMALYNPRLFLNKGDIPADILAAVPPKTERERRQAIWLGIPFMLVVVLGAFYSAYTFAVQNPGVGYWLIFAHLFLVALIPNLVDLVLLDWLLFCTINPSFFVYEGTEGFAGYKDYGFHLRMHAKGFPILVLLIALMAWVVLAVV
jgi:hypothetical protein